MKKHLLPSLLSLLLAPSLWAQGGEFRVGTWNLEFLGAEGNYRNNLPPRDDRDYAAIGRKVVELGVCVLAVQEICGEEPLRKVAAGAGPNWAVLLGTTGKWDDGKTAQSIGFLYDRTVVELLLAEELLQLPREFEGQPIFHRVPVTACFRHRNTGCDFRLVTVHLKAGQKAADAQKRRGEAQHLAAWLDALGQDQAEDPDILLLGDFNSTYGAEPERLFGHSKLRRYLQHRAPTPTIMHFAEPIDQIVAGNTFRELRTDSMLVDGDCDGLTPEAWRKTYSDHFPVTVTVVAHGDDDPQATFARGNQEQWLPRPVARPRPSPGDTVPTRPDARPAAWPPAVGARITVYVEQGKHEGLLMHPLPMDRDGWVALQTDAGVVAVPCSRVLSLRVH